MGFYEIAGLITVISFLVVNTFYIRDTLRGKTKPHMFTWLVWGLVLGIAAAVATAGGAIISAWTLGLEVGSCLIIALISARYGEKNITKSDWAMLVSALAVIPLWILSKEPLVAAIAVTTIDSLGYGPTLRKAWANPQEENLQTFVCYIGISLFSFLCITPLTLVTGMYPAGLLIMNCLLVFVLVSRRKVLA